MVSIAMRCYANSSATIPRRPRRCAPAASSNEHWLGCYFVTMLRAFSSKVKGLRSTPAAVAFLVLLAISSIVRLFAVIHFPPQTSYDTGSYVHAAHALGKLHLKAYKGFRTHA